MASIGMSTTAQVVTGEAQSSHGLQKAGGIAALIQGLFTALFLAVFLFVLPSLGFQESFFADPPKFVGFVTAHYALYYWLGLVGVLTSVVMILLVLALHERLRTASPALSAAASAFGNLGTGLLVLNWLVQYAMFSMIGSVTPAFAEQAFPAVGVIFNMTSGGAHFTLGLWTLLISTAVIRRGGFPRALAYFGLLVAVLDMAALFGVPFGELFDGIWFIALGVILFQNRSVAIQAGRI